MTAPPPARLEINLARRSEDPLRSGHAARGATAVGGCPNSTSASANTERRLVLFAPAAASAGAADEEVRTGDVHAQTGTSLDDLAMAAGLKHENMELRRQVDSDKEALEKLRLELKKVKQLERKAEHEAH